MPKPLIGITTRNGKDADGHPLTALQHSYINAIVQAGGMPILIPSMLSEEDFTGLYSLLAGILFTGGGDVSLEYFNGSAHPRIGEVDKRRDTTEITLMRAAVNDGKPLLGICRGAQVMNVALGGTLYTHIHDQVKGALDHDYPGDLRKVIVHPVNVDESTRSAEIFGETLLHVNSLHHQGLKDIAPGLRVAGHAPDGLVEVVEIPDHPYAVAVQWHPEWLTDQPAMQKLFKSFVDAAG
ncbi:MAG TPA: gamma-glutamyl-gamma-aminobutyrate hydrolase family protein [Anaerolineales bacterium]|nr:gamma-glutamyl-gamma-aminobutyrate hydrolase family protein [Anaerolineales bacterium]HMV97072.1 gamma-glutamyl-gamma-aminobutyrate hydrolase family protein [Anaerolineales bacterium]HMZ44729.1 gamma-glutamyl-gamma-aminobutyrate hydrolase family protein [Anaerolineales bacterium]HNB88293.1 gamma-glutamyl-gamma-aminobutyrate hydrolase family protein [Anaerolineales bacterium]HNC87675.1 gamma-glutamyl-gamma-aminobutyrate hydrolase family protein [Anaerolineales bacterium]